jgi:hypothetical protein
VLGVVAASILLTWLVCAAVFIGIGSLFLAQFRKEYALTDAFWMGIAIAVSILEIYHFLRPIDLGATTLIACFGFVGAFLSRRSLLAQWMKIRSAGSWTVLCYISLIVLLALRSAGPCEHYDTGLYGATAIRWATTYPVVPGLANLHGRLGYHSSVFLCMAALNQGVWRDQVHHLFVGLIIAGLLAYIVPAYFRLLRGASTSPADWFFWILLVPAMFWTADAQIVGSMTDVPATAACFAAAALLFHSLSKKSAEQDCTPNDDSNAELKIVVSMTLFALAVVFKLSTVVIAGLGWIIAFIQLWSLNSKSGKCTQLIPASLVLSAAILLPWVAWGLVQSGYPFYPKALLGIPADWQVPSVVANWETAAIRSWARMPHARLCETQGFYWIGAWVRGNLRNREGLEAPILIATAGGLAWIIALVRRRRTGARQVLWLLIPSLAGCFFWFLQAPDPRFGEAAIWTTAATLGTFGVISLVRDKEQKRRRIVLLGLAAISAWCLYPRTLWRVSGRPLLAVNSFLRLPVAKVVPRQTLSGLMVYVPAEGDQCWDAPLPCTPYFNKTLRLRRAGSTRWGFASEGLPDVPDGAGPIPGK